MYSSEVRTAEYPTLRSIWEEYRATGRLKASTERDYQKRLNLYLSDWLDVPVNQLTKDLVEQRHKQLTTHGAAQANLVMRILKALLNFAATKHEGLFDAGNPVKRLTEVRAWNRIKRRRSMILPHQMVPWFKAVLTLNNNVVRDYFLFTLMTGLRKMEAATLRWDQVDLNHRTVTIFDTKNHEDHVLPLSDYVFEILQDRYVRRRPDQPYVFPGKHAGTHLTDWRHSHAKVIADSGVPFMIHDLRRTFLTTGDGLDIPLHLLKALVNHKNRSVTEGYIVPSIERLRVPMQRITDELLRQAGVRYNTEQVKS